MSGTIKERVFETVKYCFQTSGALKSYSFQNNPYYLSVLINAFKYGKLEANG